MARSTEHAVMICTICTILALAGIAGGWYFHKPVIAVFALLPAVIYEVYRTEGASTILASWGMLAVLIAESVFIIGNLNFNLAKFMVKFIPNLPAIDIKLAGPVIMAYFSYVLIRRTAGIYTRWLAIVILIGCIGLFYVLDPAIFTKFAGTGLQESLKHIPVR